MNSTLWAPSIRRATAIKLTGSWILRGRDFVSLDELQNISFPLVQLFVICLGYLVCAWSLILIIQVAALADQAALRRSELVLVIVVAISVAPDAHSALVI